MPSNPRVRRAAIVLLMATVIGIAQAQLRDWQSGLVMGFFALVVATMATIPQDLEEGQYDTFGCALVASLPFIWIAIEVARLFRWA